MTTDQHSLSEHPDASSAAFAVWLDEYRGIPFRRITLRLDEMSVTLGAALADLKLYPKSDARVVARLADRYRAGLVVHPIVVSRHAEIGLTVLDGCHRLVAAHRAGVATIDAWEAMREPLYG